MRKKDAIFCHHVGIFSKDAKRLLDYYTKVLEFKLTKNTIVEKNVMKQIFGLGQNCQLYRLERDNMRIEIFALSGKSKAGINHFSLYVKDKDSFVKGVKNKSRIVRVKRNGYYTIFLIDPEGNRIELSDWR